MRSAGPTPPPARATLRARGGARHPRSTPHEPWPRTTRTRTPPEARPNRRARTSPRSSRR
ncbi:hypothetical protein PSMK_11330 [Phycisphaera mikurensis NBRC 102666]|uniref:Uncharacterized protein n=1 Tax=Phycisphaera mikurensis (strain NBRC 102666 / KCTC 22515 / FYK2301M01) TaxID=1142394 RepID=I0IDF4_PHYMF|nr:hypothetical protein PSMK_11330 [Phycisphaera mikurensis NBRC 102666]